MSKDRVCHALNQDFCIRMHTLGIAFANVEQEMCSNEHFQRFVCLA